MENGTGMELSLSEIFSILMKRIWLIAICLILGTAVTFAVTEYFIDEEYTASVSMYAAPNNQDVDVYASLSELNYAQQVVNTYIEILKTKTFMESVARVSGLGYSIDDLEKMVEINAVNETEIFEVQVTSTDPEASFLLANTIAKLAPQKIIEIKDTDAVRIVDPAKLPTEPSAPNVLLNTIIGFALGLVIGIMIAFLLEMLDKRVKDEDDILKHYEVPILGMVPIIKEQ